MLRSIVWLVAVCLMFVVAGPGFAEPERSFRADDGTVSADLICLPPIGAVPFSVNFDTSLTNNYTGFGRRVVAGINVSLAGGAQFNNWKGPATKDLNRGATFTYNFNQTVPALDPVIGTNTFTLYVVDITPPPYNQPPYPPSGDTDSDACEVVADEEGQPPTGMRLIPAGEYEIGDHLGTGYYEELPVHAVDIDAFYMDTFEVTNKVYCYYLNSAYSEGLIRVSGGVVYKNNDTEVYCSTTSAPPNPPFFGDSSRISWNGSTFEITTGKEEHPMVLVSWYGAAAYANWRSAREGLTPCYNLSTWECTFGAGGYRLPTEAEWEKAARGGEHSPYYDFPWGDSIDGSKANYWETGDPYETGAYPYTAPVGYYDGNQIPTGVDMANGYGLYDMAGNVWEWCNDWYDESYYQACVDYGIYSNPPGPPYSPIGHRVFRGGSWYSYDITPRCANRYNNYPTIVLHIIGFRLALESPR